MLNQMLMKGIMGLSLSFVSALGFSASIEGYWKSIEERTGEQLSIVEIRKGNDGRYHGKIVYRYPNSHGITLTNCTKCPAPNTNKPILGLEILSGFREDPDKADAYIDVAFDLAKESDKMAAQRTAIKGDAKENMKEDGADLNPNARLSKAK